MASLTTLRFSPGCGCCCAILWQGSSVEANLRPSGATSTDTFDRNIDPAPSNRYRESTFDIQNAGARRLDQRNRLLFHTQSVAGSAAAVLWKSDATAKNDGLADPPSTELVSHSPTPPDDLKIITSLTLDKTNELVYYFLLTADTAGGGERSTELRRVSYDGSGDTLIHEVCPPEVTIFKAVGACQFNPETSLIYYWQYDASTAKLFSVPVDGTAPTELHSATRGAGGTTWALSPSLDVTRGKLWFFEVPSPATGKWEPVSFDLDGTNRTVHALPHPDANRTGFVQYSYKLDKLITSTWNSTKALAADSAAGVWTLDPDYTNARLLFDPRVAINKETGSVDPIRFNSESELYCGFEVLGARYGGV